MLLAFMVTTSFSRAEETELAKASQEIHNKLYPTITVPLFIYGNQNLGTNNLTKQGELQLEPRLPISVSEDVKFIINPQFTYDANKTDQKVDNITTPVQIASYFTKNYNDFVFGIGPYIQTPASNSNNGTKQTGVGGSWGVFYKPEHWVLGGTGYIEWGVGDNMSGGSANNLNFSPAFTYIDDSAYSYTLNSKINSGFYNGKSHSTNQLVFSVAKTSKVYGIPVQFQIGPTYWVTTTPESPKGLGVFLGITGNYQL